MTRESENRLVNMRLSENGAEYLRKVASNNELTRTAALEKILSEHQEQAKQEHDQLEQAKVIGTMIAQALQESWEYDMTRIRLASNKSERTTQEIMEVLNSMLVHQHLQYEPLIGTDNTLTAMVESSREVVRNRIAHYKQISDARKTKK